MTRHAWARRCRRLLRGLELPEPFEIEALCARLGAERGRPIRLCALGFPAGGPGGLLLATASADYVFYEAQTTLAHQRHIIGHELGHLLLAHEPSGGDGAAAGFGGPAGLAGGALPDGTALGHLFARTRYVRPEEWAAEFFATELLRRVSVAREEPAAPVPDGESAELVRRPANAPAPRGRV